MMRKYGAIILAAGYSSRMGRLKPLLPVGGEAVVVRQVKLFQRIGIEQPIVVTGFQADSVAAAAEAAGAFTVFNDGYDEGMFTSVAAGVRTLAAQPRTCEAFFMLPVDIPLITGRILLSLTRLFESLTPEIVYPVFDGRRGHPPLIDVSLIPEILSHDGRGGLRSVLERHEGSSVDCDAADESVLLDMDSPEAYEDICRRWTERQTPPAEVCMRILEEQLTPEAVIAHSVKTADVALTLGGRLNEAGGSQSLPLLRTAGLLHDVARSSPNHAEEGARILRLYGLDAAADITAAHMLSDWSGAGTITEQEILYLADKLLSGTELKTLEARRAESLERKGRTPEIREAINRKFDTAVRIASAIEFLTGFTVLQLITG